jgi:hypothetical protein
MWLYKSQIAQHTIPKQNNVAAASQPVQIEDRQARCACASRMLPALMLMTQHAAGRGVDLVFNAARLYALSSHRLRVTQSEDTNLVQASTAKPFFRSVYGV